MIVAIVLVPPVSTMRGIEAVSIVASWTIASTSTQCCDDGRSSHHSWSRSFGGIRPGAPQQALPFVEISSIPVVTYVGVHIEV